MAATQALPLTDLKPHPENKRIYAGCSVGDLVASMREVGILEPLVVNARNVIISGHRRFAAASAIGLDRVPVRVESFDDETLAIVQFNRQRLKTWSDRYREIQLVLPRLKEDAAARKRSGARIGAAIRHGQPQDTICREQSRRTLDDVAAWTGLSREKVRKLMRIFEAIDSGDAPCEIIERLDRNELTIHEAFRRVSKAKRLQERQARLDADRTSGSYNVEDIVRPFDVLQFRARDPRFGRLGTPEELLDNDFGSPPPQHLVNLLHFFTEEGDDVVDLTAGRGTMHDVASYMKRRCVSFDLNPQRDFIQRHDLRTGFPSLGKHKPKLIYLDPPYGLQRQYSDCPEDLSRCRSEPEFQRALESILATTLEAMPNDALLAIIIGNEFKRGRHIDRAWAVGRFLDENAEIVRRLQLPYPASHFPDYRIGKALRGGHLLSLIREMFIARRR